MDIILFLRGFCQHQDKDDKGQHHSVRSVDSDLTYTLERSNLATEVCSSVRELNPVP